LIKVGVKTERAQFQELWAMESKECENDCGDRYGRGGTEIWENRGKEI
jgi:hypothetical protein